MGVLSPQQLRQEQTNLNPMSRSLEKSMQKIIRHKVLSTLVDQDAQATYYKQMFEGINDEDGNLLVPAQRSKHPSIPPANVRIKNF